MRHLSGFERSSEGGASAKFQIVSGICLSGIGLSSPIDMSFFVGALPLPPLFPALKRNNRVWNLLTVNGHHCTHSTVI